MHDFFKLSFEVDPPAVIGRDELSYIAVLTWPLGCPSPNELPAGIAFYKPPPHAALPIILV